MFILTVSVASGRDVVVYITIMLHIRNMNQVQHADSADPTPGIDKA